MKDRRFAAVSFPLLFAALTGRSGHGLAPYEHYWLSCSLGLRGERAGSSRSLGAHG